MKFIYADSLDFIDPGYDFLSDRSSPNREAYWTDRFPHEYLERPPYDGLLVSRGIVGDHRFPGKYSETQAMRFRRVGARAFLRLTGNGLDEFPIFGDCGAFSYHKHEMPPYSSAEVLEFYDDAGFTHGCSVDHVIFEFDRNLNGTAGGSTSARIRRDITLENADTFLRLSRDLQPRFTPLGVVQGWSPGSMADSARCLEAMGYEYIALGGMVPLNATSIHACLKAVRELTSPRTRLHLLGFAKAEQIRDFRGYGIASFDSTSPLIRAFKDASRNYYSISSDGTLEYFTAIRIPQAIENATLTRQVKAGRVRQEDLRDAECGALDAVRSYATNRTTLENCLEAILRYGRYLLDSPRVDPGTLAKRLDSLRDKYRRTLSRRAWEECPCRVCTSAGIETIIFRASNRNKRRGIHNLWTYYRYLSHIRPETLHHA